MAGTVGMGRDRRERGGIDGNGDGTFREWGESGGDRSRTAATSQEMGGNSGKGARTRRERGVSGENGAGTEQERPELGGTRGHGQSHPLSAVTIACMFA